jgi:hypothetical protein
MGLADWFSTFCTNIQVQDDGTISYRYKRITQWLNTDFWDTTYAVYQQYNRHVGNGQSALLQAVKASIENTYAMTSIKAGCKPSTGVYLDLFFGGRID